MKYNMYMSIYSYCIDSVLLEDPGSMPSTWLSTVCNSSFRGSDTLSRIHIHTCKTPMHIKK